MMRTLPLHLLDEILFKLDPKSLAKLRCTNSSFNSHISDDPNFKIEYFSRVESSLLHMSRYGSNLLCFHAFGNCRSFRFNIPSESGYCKILGSSSGLLLFSLNGLCVANPLTNKFRLLNYPKLGEKRCIGFAVDHVNRTTQRFRIVCIIERRKLSNPNETVYHFEINTGRYSWSLSKTTITCRSSNLKKRNNSKPVYLNGDLHWLRKDGSILVFNPETEEARLIPKTEETRPIPNKLDLIRRRKLLLCAGDNRLTLISATMEVISVFALETDGKWILVRRIKNEAVNKSKPSSYWNVHAYDGKRLVVMTMTICYSVVHGYDLRANKWGVMDSIPTWCDHNRDFFLFKPSWSHVIGLLDQKEVKDVLKTTLRYTPYPLAKAKSERISSVIICAVSKIILFSHGV